MNTIEEQIDDFKCEIKYMQNSIKLLEEQINDISEIQDLELVGALSELTTKRLSKMFEVISKIHGDAFKQLGKPGDSIKEKLFMSISNTFKRH